MASFVVKPSGRKPYSLLDLKKSREGCLTASTTLTCWSSWSCRGVPDICQGCDDVKDPNDAVLKRGFTWRYRARDQGCRCDLGQVEGARASGRVFDKQAIAGAGVHIPLLEPTFDAFDNLCPLPGQEKKKKAAMTYSQDI